MDRAKNMSSSMIVDQQFVTFFSDHASCATLFVSQQADGHYHSIQNWPLFEVEWPNKIYIYILGIMCRFEMMFIKNRSSSTKRKNFHLRVHQELLRIFQPSIALLCNFEKQLICSKTTCMARVEEFCSLHCQLQNMLKSYTWMLPCLGTMEKLLSLVIVLWNHHLIY